MPFAWTAVYLMNVINSANSLDAEKEQQSRSDSLGLYVVMCYVLLAISIAIITALLVR